MIQGFTVEDTPLGSAVDSSAVNMAGLLALEGLHHIRVFPDVGTTDMLGRLLKPVNKKALHDAERTNLKARGEAKKLAKLLARAADGDTGEEWKKDVSAALASMEYQPSFKEIPHDETRTD